MTTGPEAPAASLYSDLDLPAPLEALLGDPDDPGNPLGFAAFLAADERGDLLATGERALDSYGLGAEFVPVVLGGRLRQADHLARVLRPLFRRDVALGLGHGAGNLAGSVHVWSSGSPRQRRWLADVLLGNGRIAAGPTDPSSGSARSGLSTRTRNGRPVLAGRQEMISDIARAQALTVLARTGDGPDGCSLLLLDMAQVPRDRLRFLPRHRTNGARAMYLGGLEFQDCPVPGAALTGDAGGATGTVLRASQVIRAVLPAAAVGTLDQQLRTVMDFATERRLYGRVITELPHTRALLTGAYLDLLIADCFATTVCRSLHVLPGPAGVYAAAVKQLVPPLMRDTVDALSVVLGARSFLREGPQGGFQKHLRDLPVASLEYAGGTVCQAALIPQLPRMADGWLSDDGAPDELFRISHALPDLDLERLSGPVGRRDPLMAVLTEAAQELRGDPVLGPLCRQLTGELARLRQQCLEPQPGDSGGPAGPAAFVLAERYAILLAAAACLGVWRHNGDNPSAFLRGSGWTAGVLSRLAARLGCPPVLGADAEQEAVFAELSERHRTHRGFDLTGRQLA